MKSSPRDDGGLPDDAGLPGDAQSDVPPTPSREVVGGAGRLTGATFTLDVEIGHPVSQQPIAGATHTIEGNAAVKP